MNVKLIVTVVLLSFVAVSVGMMIVREPGGEHVSVSAGAIPAASRNAASPSREDGVGVYYFHGNMRCPTCRRIEAYAQETLESLFREELADGTIVWQAVNYELPENTHFVTDYQLIAPTVVVVERRSSQQVAWRSLDRVWQLVGNQPAFAAYIQDGVKAHLTEGTHE